MHGSEAERWRTRSQQLDPHARLHAVHRSETSGGLRIRCHEYDGWTDEDTNGNKEFLMITKTKWHNFRTVTTRSIHTLLQPCSLQRALGTAVQFPSSFAPSILNENIISNRVVITINIPRPRYEDQQELTKEKSNPLDHVWVNSGYFVKHPFSSIPLYPDVCLFESRLHSIRGPKAGVWATNKWYDLFPQEATPCAGTCEALMHRDIWIFPLRT